MRIRTLEPAPFFDLENLHLAAGYSMMFARDWSYGLTPYAVSVSEVFLEEETARRLGRRVVDNRWDFDFFDPPEVTARLNGTVVPVNIGAGPNYYHLLIEALPGLLRLIDLGKIAPETRLVMGDLHPNAEAALDFILGSAGLQPSKLRLDVGQAVLCDRIVTTPPAAHGFVRLDKTISDFTVDGSALATLRDRFERLRANATGPRKLYIRRVSLVRNVVNAEALEALAAASGYEVVEPQHLSFEDQVRLFASATHIVGPTGAWAANLLFSLPGTVVRIFMPETARTERSPWKGMAAGLALDVQEIYCPVGDVWRMHPFHSNFAVPEEIARAAFAGAELTP